MGRSGQGWFRSLALPRWGGPGGFVRPAKLAGVFLLGLLAGATLLPGRYAPAPGPGQTPSPHLAPGGGFAAAQPNPPVSPTRAAESKREGIRFAAYNVKNYLSMNREVKAKTVERAPKPESEIAVVVDSIVQARPEILGICEIGGLPEVEDLRRRLRDRGLEHPHVEWVDGADEERHLALLSVFPILERASQTGLTYLLKDREYPVQRGFLDVTIAVNRDYRLRCVGVHLKSKREVEAGDQDLMRRNEAHVLRRYVDNIQRSRPEENLLVYGDFNDTCNEASIRAIQGAPGSPGHLAALRLRDDQGETWTHRWVTADVYSRIDFLFYSRALAPEIQRDRSFILARDDWEMGSDHRMLVTEIIPIDRRR